MTKCFHLAILPVNELRVAEFQWWEIKKLFSGAICLAQRVPTDIINMVDDAFKVSSSCKSGLQMIHVWIMTLKCSKWCYALGTFWCFNIWQTEATDFKSFQRQELQPWQKTSGGTFLVWYKGRTFYKTQLTKKGVDHLVMWYFLFSTTERQKRVLNDCVLVCRVRRA